jgi:hypothetical protein
MMSNSAEEIHPARLIEINIDTGNREVLEAKYGPIWDTNELAREFEVLGSLTPFVVVRRKPDGVTGSLGFQHAPRFYFSSVPDLRPSCLQTEGGS